MGYQSKSSPSSGAISAVDFLDNNRLVFADNMPDFKLVTFNFDASKSSNIYAASTTVQPPAIILVPQIKY